MLELLIILTVAEIMLVLVVLAVYLARVRTSLRTTADVLGKVAFGVRAIETQTAAMAPGIARINGVLEDISTAAPRLAESLARGHGR